jgi:hypothetical protein
MTKRSLFKYFKTSPEIIRLAVMATWQHWMIYAAPSFPCILQRKAQENVGECYPKESIPQLSAVVW